METYTDNTRIIDLTVAQLRELIVKTITENQQPNVPMQEDVIKGINGLCNLLGWSKSTAHRKLQTGMFRRATYRDGRMVCFSKSKVLEILSNF